MDNGPCYVLELLKLLAEFSFNLLLKIKLSFFLESVPFSPCGSSFYLDW